MLHRLPHVSLTARAFVWWWLGDVMIQHKTRTFSYRSGPLSSWITRIQNLIKSKFNFRNPKGDFLPTALAVLLKFDDWITGSNLATVPVNLKLLKLNWELSVLLKITLQLNWKVDKRDDATGTKTKDKNRFKWQLSRKSIHFVHFSF